MTQAGEVVAAVLWEYAIWVWDGDRPDDFRFVRFGHREKWKQIAGNEYLPTLGELGDAGFELVAHQFLVRGQYERGGRFGEIIRETMTFQRPLEDRRLIEVDDERLLRGIGRASDQRPLADGDIQSAGGPARTWMGRRTPI